MRRSPVVQGDEAFYLWRRDRPWKLVFSDYRFFPGTQIKDGAQLVTAIHRISPFQRMAIVTADPEEAKRRLPEALRGIPILRKPFRLGQLLRLLRQPVLPL